MNPVVAFDIGKVLLDFDYGILIAKLAPRTQWDKGVLDAYLNQSPLLAEYESGRLTSSEFFTRIQSETKFNGTESEFAGLFKNIFTPIEAVINMHRQLVESGVPTYTFSNTNEMAVRHISRSYEFWPRFTGHILSHEVKSAWRGVRQKHHVPVSGGHHCHAATVVCPAWAGSLWLLAWNVEPQRCATGAATSRS